MLSSLYRFLNEEEGATAIEYGLIAALIGVVLIGGVTAFGGAMTNMYSSVSEEVGDAMP